MKLHNKLLSSYLIVGLIPLIIIGVYANTYLKQEKFREISEFFMAQLSQIDFTISTFLTDVEYDVENLANTSLVRTRADDNFTNFLEADEQTFAYAIGETEQQIIDIFATYRATHPYANSVYMGRANGTFVRSHERSRFTPYDPRIRPWYQLALSHPDKALRTAPYTSVTTDDINIGTVKALVDEANTIFGVVGVDITLKGLTTVISQIKLRTESYITLLDDQGIILTHPSQDKLFKHYDDVGLADFQYIMTTQRGDLAFSDNGKRHYAFFYTSPLLGWKICAVVPERAIKKEINHLVNTIMALLGLTLVLGGGQALYVARRITTPIHLLVRRITQFVTHLREKQPFERIRIDASDEIVTLAKAFNTMGTELFAAHRELSKHSANLERKVEQRTQELSQTNQHLVQEISERQQAEETLAGERNLLRTVLDNLPEYIYVKDTEGRFVLANEASARSLHLATLDDLIGKTDFDLFPQALAEQFYADEQHVIKSGHALINKEELILDRISGDMRWFLTTKVPLRNTQRNIVGIVGLSRDITENKRVQDEVRKLSRAVEQSANTIIITDLNGTMEFVNPAFSMTTGYTFEEAIGNNPHLLKSGKMAPEIYQDLWDTIHRGEVWKGELINKKKNGELYWEFTTISPIKDQTGYPTHYVAVKENITDRKQMEAELRKAKEAAEAANEAKGRFLANMSHELRTPLNGILGYAQILKREKHLTESQQKGLDIIEHSGNHLLNLINDILDLSKIEAHKIKLHETPVPMLSFLHEIVEVIQVQAEKKKLTFDFVPASDLPNAIRADEKRLKQVLLNLLGNAVKFTESGGMVSFNVSDKSDKSDLSNIRFEVEDTGIGISEADLQEIFSPFKQVGDRISPAEGAGLGLAISQQLVQLMGGELFVKSVVGKGSTFWFEVEFPEVSDWTVTPEPEKRQVVGYKGAKQTILVIDDKWENRILLVSMLSSLGFEILEAADGRDGLNKAMEFHPDLIFMDLIMPVMDGFEATRHIRKSPALIQTKVIAISASTLISPDRILAEFGCDDYLPKPLQMQAVLEKLATHLGLEWIYEDQAEPGIRDHAIPLAGQAEDEDLVAPPLADINMLYEFALDGNFKELRAHLAGVEHRETRYARFIERVRMLAKTLDEDAICTFLNRYRSV